MGFDIYGMNPQTDKPEPPQPAMKGGEWTDKEKKQWEKYEEWREERIKESKFKFRIGLCKKVFTHYGPKRKEMLSVYTL